MIYIENKYTKCYYSIIQRARRRVLDGYKERHHIIPRSLGGSDDPENLVDLTAREHFVCHLLLTKMVSNEGDRAKMVLAAMWFKKFEGLINNRTYEVLRKFISEQRSRDYTGKYKGIPKPKHSESMKAHWSNLSPEERKQRTANFGKPCSESTKSKIAAANAAKWVKKRETGDMPVVDEAYREKKRAAARARWAKKNESLES